MCPYEQISEPMRKVKSLKKAVWENGKIGK